MDRKQFYADLAQVLEVHSRAVRNEIWTALPAIVRAVNLEAQTVNVQPTIQGRKQPAQRAQRAEDPYEPEWLDMPELLDCPLVFPRGGNYLISFPVSPGDEVLVVFASRCIDGWWESGQVSPQLDYRMHSLSDGFVIPGVVSKGAAAAGLPAPSIGGGDGPAPLSGDALEIRSKDGLTSVKMGEEVLAVKHPVLITLDAPLILANGIPIP